MILISMIVHCRAQEKFGLSGTEFEVVRMDHFELMISSTKIEAKPSKLIKDWMNWVEFRLFMMGYQLGDTRQLWKNR